MATLAGDPKPYILITKVQAESGAWSYEIRTSLVDGVTYCTCPGFFIHGKKCKHMDAWKAHPTFKPGESSNAPHPTFARAKRKRALKAPAVTPATLLVGELGRLNIVITLQQANDIVRKLAALATEPVATAAPVVNLPTTASIGEHGGARVIIIPD